MGFYVEQAQLEHGEQPDRPGSNDNGVGFDRTRSSVLCSSFLHNAHPRCGYSCRVGGGPIPVDQKFTRRLCQSAHRPISDCPINSPN